MTSQTITYHLIEAESRQAMFEQFADSLLVKHVAQPEEIAEALIYLAKHIHNRNSHSGRWWRNAVWQLNVSNN